MIKKKQSKTCLMTALSHTNTETEMGWLDHKQICRKWFVSFFVNLTFFLSVRVKKETNSDDGENRYGQISENNKNT